MKIGFYFNDRGFSNLDLHSPIEGNNGVGGTQYCFLMVADALEKYSNYEVVFYHYNENIFPIGVESIIIRDRNEILERTSKDGIDILVFKTEGITDFVHRLRKTCIRTIAWAHNYLMSEELSEYCNNPAVSRVVFVGHEMYDRYIDHPIMKKATFIYNMFDGRVFDVRPVPQVPSVTYTGSLVPAKGFHLLAEVWKDIVKVIPNAQLYVIGNGKLYDRKAELGPFGVAQKQYEERIMPYLTNEDKLMDSVHFMGTMGHEKLDVYKMTTVGVMNPTGRTETFGLSAIEMSACGIPVITKRANGLYDTVIDCKTGFLIRNKRDLFKKMIKLLVDRELNIALGNKGKEFADSAFLPENIVKVWIALFEDILNGKNNQQIEPSKHYLNNAKWLRIINLNIQKTGIKTKPIIDIECMVREKVLRH